MLYYSCLSSAISKRKASGGIYHANSSVHCRRSSTSVHNHTTNVNWPSSMQSCLWFPACVWPTWLHSSLDCHRRSTCFNWASSAMLSNNRVAAGLRASWVHSTVADYSSTASSDLRGPTTTGFNLCDSTATNLQLGWLSASLWTRRMHSSKGEANDSSDSDYPNSRLCTTDLHPVTRGLRSSYWKSAKV